MSIKADTQNATSLSGRTWIYTSCDARVVETIIQRHNLPELVAQVLAARDIDLDYIEQFLTPALKTALPDPSHLKDMDKAVERLARAITDNQKIVVFGDYDVDGATSTAVLTGFLREVGANAEFYIPDRLEEGYGPNANALLKLGEQGKNLLVTVDCGAVAHEPLKAAHDAGIDVIVIDHHISEWTLPPAYAVVNPNRMDEDTNCGILAAVGVVFLTCVALNRYLRQHNYYQDKKEPDLLRYLDLVALGTVCDVVPLTGLNRAFVAQGLKVMSQRTNLGLATLADWVQIDQAPNAFHASHVFGPRINASGRIGPASLGAKLLLSKDPVEAKQIVQRLDELNTDRKQLEAVAYQEAVQIVEASPPSAMLFVVGQDWHQGVIGIVASRLKEKYNKPVVVMTQEGQKVKGSGRSVVPIDLGAAITAARQNQLLLSGGGHAMAAGLTTTADKLPQLQAFLSDHIERQLQEKTFVHQLDICARLAVNGANLDMLEILSKLAPFGSGNPEPVFAIHNAIIHKPQIFGQDHVRCFIADTAGGSLRGVAYRMADDPTGQAILKSAGAPLHLAGKLRLNCWQGRQNVDFIIEDVSSVWNG